MGGDQGQSVGTKAAKMYKRKYGKCEHIHEEPLLEDIQQNGESVFRYDKTSQ
jgi:hypothetical protein